MKGTHRPMWSTLAVALLGFGCTNGEGPAPADQDEALEETAGDEGHFEGRHPGWRHGQKGGHLLRLALEEVELSPEQRTKIEGLLERREDRIEERRENRHEQKEAILAAVRAGDVAALEAAAARMEERSSEKAARMASTLNELHATLDSAQRQALVAAVREKVEHHRERRAGRMDQGGPEGDLSPEGRPHRRGGRVHARKMHRLVEALDLTDEQRARLEAAHEEAGLAPPSPEEWRQRHEAHRARVDEMITAFERDDFDANQLGLAEHFHGMATARMEHRTKGLALLVPILTEEQRELLADRMERRFEGGRFEGRHHRRHRPGGGR